MKFNKFKDKKKYPSFELLEQEFGFFLKQLVIDKELSLQEKNSCLETICVIPRTTKEEYQKECNNSFFYANKLKGKICKSIQSQNPFVRVNDKDSIVEWIAILTGMKPSTAKNKLSEIVIAEKSSRALLLNSFLNNYILPINYQNQNNCFSYFGVKTWSFRQPPKLKDAHLCFFKSIQWSFPTPSTENIFFDQSTIENIKCRAGIVDTNTKIIFQHKLDDKYNVRKPTSFDAGFYYQFQPNGVTKPLPSCHTLSGFDEFVHIPNKFENLLDNIYETYKN